MIERNHYVVCRQVQSRLGDSGCSYVLRHKSGVVRITGDDGTLGSNNPSLAHSRTDCIQRQSWRHLEIILENAVESGRTAAAIDRVEW